MARYEIRMTFKNLLVERDEPVALVTFNRPKVLNALNSETLDEFSQVLRELRDDATIRCVVLTGAGEKAFVAGADIKELAVQTPVSGRNHARRGQQIFDLVENLGRPISFPVEYRVLGPDQIPLSTSFGRPTAYIAVHVFRRTPYEDYFRGVEAIMDDYGGRPHWGKLHFHSSSVLCDRYPQWYRFQAARKLLDPAGRFTNDYLDWALGS